MGKYRYAHCNDLAVSGLHNLHVCWKNDSLLERATMHWFHILVDCCVVLDLFYICQRMNNWLDLVYFDVSHGTSFFNIHVDCELQTLPNHCNEHFYTFSYMLTMISYLFVYCCFLYHPPRSQLYPYHMFLYRKSYNQIVRCRLSHWSVTIIQWQKPFYCTSWLLC